MAAAKRNKQPDYNVYIVTDNKDKTKPGFWTKAGAAWANQDGGGFSIQLGAHSLDGRYVMRTPKGDEQT